jgi:hypothetical protein
LPGAGTTGFSTWNSKYGWSGHHRAGAADDALRDAALDSLAAEVGLVDDLLAEVDVRDHVRDLDRRGEHLKALRRRRRDGHVRWRRRRRLVLRRRRFVLLHLDELDLLFLRLLGLNRRVRCRVHGRGTDRRVEDHAEDRPAQAPLLLRLRLEQIVEHGTPS